MKLKLWSGTALQIVAATFISTQTLAADFSICDAVLQSKNFNYYESNTVSDYVDDLKNKVCQGNWEKQDHFKQFDTHFTTRFEFFEVMGGGTEGDSKDRSHKINELKREFCQDFSSSLRYKFLQSTKMRNADTAVKAWENCVLKKSGLFSRILLNQNADEVHIEFNYEGTGQVGVDKLKLVGYERNHGYSCSFLNNDIDNLVPIDLTGNQRGTIVCGKDPNKAVTISIETNIDKEHIGPYQIPSAKVMELNSQVDELQSQLSDLSVQMEKLKLIASKPKPYVSLSAYGGQTVQSVGHTCENGGVLVGMEFDFPALGKHRTVAGVRYRCAEIVHSK
jgi:hypothetical protein